MQETRANSGWLKRKMGFSTAIVTVCVSVSVLMVLATGVGAASTRDTTSGTQRDALSQTRQIEDPRITINANYSEYIAGFGHLIFTLMREGSTSEEVSVNVNITQTQPWLKDLVQTLTFPSGADEKSLIFGGSGFSSSVTESGSLTASVTPIEGYDVEDARVEVQVTSVDGPAVRVGFDRSAFTFAEDAGEVDITVVARAAPELSFVPEFFVSVLIVEDEASAIPGGENKGGDYLNFSQRVKIANSNFAEENGQLVARVNANAAVTILDDDVFEGNERFYIELARLPDLSKKVILVSYPGNDCNVDCGNSYRATIVDNDEEPNFRPHLSTNHVGEADGAEGEILVSVASDNGKSYGTDQTITVHFSGSATLGGDFTVMPEDEDDAPGIQTTLEAGNNSVELRLFVIDDAVADPCEWIMVWAEYGQDITKYSPQLMVTFVDDDNVAGVTTHLELGLNHMQAGTITKADDGVDWYSFTATGGETYIIEVKRPLGFTGPHVPAAGGDAILVPGSLVDPSILRVVDEGDVQVLDEHDQGGFALNFARAYFVPEEDGTYRIAVGAGSQDRTALGCYTISVRVDDHADDYKTNPDVLLRPGDSVSASIDSDVGQDDARLNSWDWAAFGGESAVPRRGIESMDDRDVFRIEISVAGEYRVTVSDQPTGVGVWYVWDSMGNLWLDFEDSPVEQLEGHFEPGKYYVEVGTPYESEGNTGTYTVSVEAVTSG